MIQGDLRLLSHRVEVEAVAFFQLRIGLHVKRMLLLLVLLLILLRIN